MRTLTKWLMTVAVLVGVAGVAMGMMLKPAEPAPQAAASAPFVPKHAGMQPTVVTPPPAEKKHLYDDDGDPKKEIAAGLKQAKAEHKRVILDFGGDWCGDCQVLDIYMHQAPNAELLAKNFVVVHISVGHLDKNLDVPAKYGVDVSHGVPALGVLDSNGKVLYAQATGEFEAMRRMYSSSVTEFLTKWKA